MRKQSLMYQESGGMDYRHKCNECNNLVEMRRGKRMYYKCRAYGVTEGYETDWPEQAMACRLFGQEPWKVPLIERKNEPRKKAGLTVRDDVVGQYHIYDYPDFLPEKESE